MATQPIRIGALASGNGSNLQAILDACGRAEISGEVALVLSNNPDAFALERARRAGVPARCIDHRHYSDRETFDRELVAALQQAQVDLVVLAGFMRRLTPAFVDAFEGRIMNIHPSLLPAFPGLHVQRQALEYGVRLAGCTVHFVDNGLDTGPIILQAAVPVLEDDNEESLSARILEQEHRIYPRAIQLFAQGRLRLEGRRVRLLDSASQASTALIHPPLTP